MIRSPITSHDLAKPFKYPFRINTRKLLIVLDIAQNQTGIHFLKECLMCAMLGILAILIAIPMSVNSS